MLTFSPPIIGAPSGPFTCGAIQIGAHLRLRGEHRATRRNRPPRPGSPPPARRAPLLRRSRCPSSRLTSACAESTVLVVVGGVAGAAHLRLRGEHEIWTEQITYWHGSPPPARRAPLRRTRIRPPGRLTSACAESTGGAGGAASGGAAHLRLRGEHATGPYAWLRSNGSPRPARRARWQVRSGRCRDPAHLRLRGEHVCCRSPNRAHAGSPPPARRAQDYLSRYADRFWLTSACAESTDRGGVETS